MGWNLMEVFQGEGRRHAAGPWRLPAWHVYLAGALLSSFPDEFSFLQVRTKGVGNSILVDFFFGRFSLGS